MIEETKNNTIRVIVCRPGKEAEIAEIEETLEAMQEIIGGALDEYMPFTSEDQREDDIVIVCDHDGTMKKLPPCRAIRDEEGHVQDIIEGSFFICSGPLGSSSYESLPSDLEEKYLNMFRYPELFYTTDEGLTSVKLDPEARKYEFDQRKSQEFWMI